MGEGRIFSTEMQEAEQFRVRALKDRIRNESRMHRLNELVSEISKIPAVDSPSEKLADHADRPNALL